MEEDFGRQRKSFMNQMAQCDAKVSQYKHNLDKYSKEVQELSRVVLRKEEELQNVTIAAGITEATIRETFDADRVKYEEEIASLRKIVSGELLVQSLTRSYLTYFIDTKSEDSSHQVTFGRLRRSSGIRQT